MAFCREQIGRTASPWRSYGRGMTSPAAPPARPTSAWRRTIGRLLRRAREEQGLRLADVAERARLSPQYLSEVERGLKEPSSEVLAALTGALGVTLADLALALGSELEQRRAPVRVLHLTSQGGSSSAVGAGPVGASAWGPDVVALAA